ncbi:hypothetical protein BC828DRAFT_112046 [Blastocladiella britannica]|nr:hypothetical protein BC828DRAFT_112046 [Blastocladiella britannica]
MPVPILPIHPPPTSLATAWSTHFELATGLCWDRLHGGSTPVPALTIFGKRERTDPHLNGILEELRRKDGSRHKLTQTDIYERLRDLELSCFKIQSLEPPTVLQKFSALARLDLCGNRIHALDQAILPRTLREMNLSLNQFTAFPEIASLTLLLHFNIGFNEITTLPPALSTRVPPSLRSLDLSHNLLENREMALASLASVRSLRILGLMGNPTSLCYRYAADVIQHIPHLQSLDGVPFSTLFDPTSTSSLLLSSPGGAPTAEVKLFLGTVTGIPNDAVSAVLRSISSESSGSLAATATTTITTATAALNGGVLLGSEPVTVTPPVAGSTPAAADGAVSEDPSLSVLVSIEFFGICTKLLPLVPFSQLMADAAAGAGGGGAHHIPKTKGTKETAGGALPAHSDTLAAMDTCSAAFNLCMDLAALADADLCNLLDNPVPLKVYRHVVKSEQTVTATNALSPSDRPGSSGPSGGGGGGGGRSPSTSNTTAAKNAKSPQVPKKIKEHGAAGGGAVSESKRLVHVASQLVAEIDLNLSEFLEGQDAIMYTPALQVRPLLLRRRQGAENGGDSAHDHPIPLSLEVALLLHRADRVNDTLTFTQASAELLTAEFARLRDPPVVPGANGVAGGDDKVGAGVDMDGIKGRGEAKKAAVAGAAPSPKKK